MKFQPDCEDIEPFGEAQLKLLPWLSEGDPEAAGLLERLEGLHLPAAGSADEPYVWILRGLPRGGQRGPASKELADRVRFLLARSPDVEPFGKRPEQTVHNLLMLAASLADPDKLAGPLFDMLGRKRIQGEWVGQDLRRALLAALMYNQPDSRLNTTWEDMLTRNGVGFLPGGPYDGFHGALLMPRDAASRGKPALDLIGWALRRMADFLAELHAADRRPRFRMLLRRLQETYPGHNDWNAKLLHMADKAEWPRWAVHSLPGLPPPAWAQRGDAGVFQTLLRALVGRGESFSTRYILRDVQRFVPNAKVIASVCGGEILEIEHPRDQPAYLDLLMTSLEESLRKNPFSSDASTIGAANQAMIAVGRKLEEDYGAANTVFESHRLEFLREKQLPSPRSQAA